MFVTVPTPSIDPLLKLPKKRRMAIAERLWLSVAAGQIAPVPSAHRKTGSARLAAYQSGQSKPVSHDEMMRKLRVRRTVSRWSRYPRSSKISKAR